MPGIQISGLLANSAFDWKSVVDQLVEVSATPIKKLNAEKDYNSAQAEALAGLGAALTALQDSVQAMRADEIFSARTVSSDLVGTTWKSSSVKGAGIGSYAFNVTQLATQAHLRGTANLGDALAPSDDVSGLTLANLATATAVTAGIFTVDGSQVSVSLTDSLQDVLDRIATATGGAVTGAYDHLTDRLTLTKSSGELVLGAGNDTSNFLAVMKLANNGGAAVTSSADLGTVKASATLASAGLRTPITAVDGAGDGSFQINGVTVTFNVNTDSLRSVINRINDAGAGVTASYDAASDRMTLTNKSTGDIGIAVSEADGGLLAALGLSAAAGGSLVHGKNAQFTVNGGAVLTSVGNTLDASVHGIEGLSVTVNSETAQVLQVESDTQVMQEALGDFIEKFNAVQDFIEENTQVSVGGGSITTAVLSSNREVQDWSRRLRSLAFDAVGGITGEITRLDHLGIDFDSTSNHLVIKDAGKLATALSDKPDDVESMFLSSSVGLVPRFYSYLGTLTSAGRSQQNRLGEANTKLDEQIATLQTRLEAEREQLTNAFIHMLDAQSTAQSQNTYLTNTFFKNNSNN